MLDAARAKDNPKRSFPAPYGILGLLIGLCAFGLIYAGCSGKPKFDPLVVSGNEEIISYYRFGTITINHKTYRSDIVIFPDSVKYNWFDLSNHMIEPETIKNSKLENIKVLMIGTGAQGGVAVSKAARVYLKSLGIEIHVMDTWNAVKLYNTSRKENLAAILHLDC